MKSPVIHSYENGTIRSISWYDDNGDSHCIDGPAQTEYWANGNIRWMVWNIHNEHHRTDGPAYIYYDEQGNLDGKYWYVNNVKIEDMNDWLEENNITNPYSDEDRMAIKLYLS